MRLAVASILLLAAPLIAVAQSNPKCAGMALFRSPGMTLEITRAAVIPESRAPGGRGGGVGPMLPAHCRVDGVIDRRMGSDGKTYGIRFAIALPDNWSGQFLQQGGGGLNESVAEPTGAQAAGDQPALVRGFAVATTDTGHQGTTTFDGAFMQDQLAALDFEYVAIGRVATLTK
jgi:feruloyl esterase